MAYLGNTLINGSLRCLNKAYFNDLSVSGTTSFANLDVSGKTTTNQLVVSAENLSNLVATNSSTGAIPVVIGSPTSKHIASDADAIQAKNGVTAVSALYINYGGGAVYLSNNGTVYANNGSLYATNLGSSSAQVNNAYISTGNITTLKTADVTADNVTVNNVLKSSKWDISNVANLANDFMVAPTIKISSSGTVTIASLNTTAKTCRLTFSDSSQINSDEFAGCKWYAGSKVRVTFTVNGTLNSNILGTIVNNMNTTAGTLVVDVTLDNTTNLANGTYEADDSTIMLYEISNSGTLSPVGIRMTAYGTNNSSYIDMYGGTTTTDYTHPIVRIGRLNGITFNGKTFGTDEELPAVWGIYTRNGYFEGAIIANEGKIGEWTIDAKKIYTGTWGSNNSAMVSPGTTSTDGAKSIGGSDSIDGWTFTSGANFGVTKTGALYANDVNISGAVNATALHVGSSTSTNHLIYENNNIDLQTDWLRFDNSTSTVIIGEDNNNVVNIKPRYMSMTNDVGTDYLKIGDNRYYDDDLGMWVSSVTEAFSSHKNSDNIAYLSAFYHPVSIIKIVNEQGETVTNYTISGNNILMPDEPTNYGDYEITYLTDSLNVMFLLGNNNTVTDSIYPMVVGLRCTVGNKYSFVRGCFSAASGEYSYASGYIAEASGNYSSSIGRSVEASGDYSFAYGVNSKATGYESIAYGSSCISSSYNSVAIGSQATSTSSSSLAFGDLATASSSGAVSIGHRTTASGYHSLSLGYYTNALNDYSIALGNTTTSDGRYSIANGYASLAVANYTIANGYMVEANKGFSTALGYKTKANGDYSIALGYSSIASGFDSFARGLNSQATNNHSFASGYYCLASGDSSVAQNLKTIATIEGQTVIGKYNAITKDYLSIICSPDVICGDDTIVDGTAYVPNSGDYAFVIGNGFSENDRYNALTVDWDGKITSYSTNITVGSSPSSNTYNPSYILADRNGTRTGWLQQAQYTDGRIGTRVETIRTINGSDVAHGFCQLIDDSGNRTVTFSDNAAWRTGLGLSHILDMVRVTEFKKANVEINANNSITVEIDYTVPSGFNAGSTVTWRIDSTNTTSAANQSWCVVTNHWISTSDNKIHATVRNFASSKAIVTVNVKVLFLRNTL